MKSHLPNCQTMDQCICDETNFPEPSGLDETPPASQTTATESPTLTGVLDSEAAGGEFDLHGFSFTTSEERQNAAFSHPLWGKYLEWDRRSHCGVPDMGDAHDREVFEAYIEGAYQQWQALKEESP